MSLIQRFTTTQEYSTHSDEEDPERIDQIMQRAVQDMEWIIEKASFFSLPVGFCTTQHNIICSMKRDEGELKIYIMNNIESVSVRILYLFHVSWSASVHKCGCISCARKKGQIILLVVLGGDLMKNVANLAV